LALWLLLVVPVQYVLLFVIVCLLDFISSMIGSRCPVPEALVWYWRMGSKLLPEVVYLYYR